MMQQMADPFSNIMFSLSSSGSSILTPKHSLGSSTISSGSIEMLKQSCPASPSAGVAVSDPLRDVKSTSGSAVCV